MLGVLLKEKSGQLDMPLGSWFVCIFSNFGSLFNQSPRLGIRYLIHYSLFPNTLSIIEKINHPQ